MIIPVECLPDNSLGAVAKPLIESNDPDNDSIFQALKLVGKIGQWSDILQSALA